MADSKFIPITNPAPSFIDLSGQRFGRLTAIAPFRMGKATVWRCLCDCGTETMTHAPSLRRGSTKSCGCLHREIATRSSTTHGGVGTRTYKIWEAMRGRCDRPTDARYADYGGRGITYDPRWSDYANFLADMGPAPDGLQIDREDNNGNYCKDNCRWVTRMVNVSNTRRNRYLEIDGRRVTESEFAREHGLNYGTFRNRLRNGFSLEAAMSATSLPRRR